MKDCYDYHAKTAHTYYSVRRPHFLDWSNYPSPFKVYSDVEFFSLPPVEIKSTDTLSTLYGLCEVGPLKKLGIYEVSGLCFSMNGITKVENFHGELFGFRATPSAGALYPFELYLYIEGIKELPEGIFHYQPYNHSLELLAEGNFKKEVEEGLCCKLSTNVAAFISTIYARSAWKYRERAYRYCLLDAGHMAGNGVPFLKSLGLEGRAISLFKDSLVNGLLGLDGKSEFVLCSLVAERPIKKEGKGEANINYKLPKAEPVVRREIRAPLIEEAHALGELKNCDFEREFKETAYRERPKIKSLPLIEVLRKRRSRRDFKGEEMSLSLFNHIVNSSLKCFPGDWGSLKLTTYIQTRKVEGVPDGIYSLKGNMLEPLAYGDFSREISSLCLSQRFVSLANFNVIFTYDFERGDGCRDYRGALLEAGALGELLYLSAESLNCGACGIGAFYDFDLQGFLGLKRKELPVYVISVGVI